MGISTLYEEIDDGAIPFLQRMSDDQLKELIHLLLSEQPRVFAFESVSCSEIPSDEFCDDDWKTQGDHPTLYFISKAVNGSGGSVELEQKSKYWKIKTSWSRTITEYGAKGRQGRVETKQWSSPAEAKDYAESMIRKKLAAGYKKVVDKLQKEVQAALETMDKMKTNTDEKQEQPSSRKRKEAEKSEEGEEITEDSIKKMKKDQLVKLLSSWGEKEADLKKKAVKVLKEEALKKLQEQKEKGQGKEERGKEEEQEEPPSKKQKIEDDKKEEGKKEIQQPAALTEAAEEGGHHWHKLSDDCIVNIFRMLPSGEEAAKVASVCSKWNSLLKNDKLWEGFYMKRWGGEVHPQRLEKLKEKTASGKASWKDIYAQQSLWDQKNRKAKTADLDKAAAAVEYVIGLKHNLVNLKNEFPDLPLDKFLQPTAIGQDVCYGPIYVVSSENAAKLYELVKDMTVEEATSLYRPGAPDFVPKLLGGLNCDPSQVDADREYIGIHFQNLKMFLANCVRRGRGFIRHFY